MLRDKPILIFALRGNICCRSNRFYAILLGFNLYPSRPRRLAASQECLRRPAPDRGSPWSGFYSSWQYAISEIRTQEEQLDGSDIDYCIIKRVKIFVESNAPMLSAQWKCNADPVQERLAKFDVRCDASDIASPSSINQSIQSSHRTVRAVPVRQPSQSG